MTAIFVWTISDLIGAILLTIVAILFAICGLCVLFEKVAHWYNNIGRRKDD